MSKYFLVESRSPFDSGEVNNNCELAKDLAEAGHETTLFLVENAVFAARKAIAHTPIANLDGVKVLVDGFSLRERGIGEEEIISTVTTADIDCLVEAMAEGQKTLWL
ncbi:MAG: DsrE family protein [Synechococcaceae cyanobacterium RL_1_2]|nr:DsrE family protein [Synechococcaceae cyanobacterium RL_1_2]